MRPPSAGPSRRRHPRIEIDGGLDALDITQGHAVSIRDVSARGFQTQGPRGTTLGALHWFRIVLRTGQTCVVRATAVHSRAAPGSGGTWLVGWQTLPDAVTTASLHRLIEDVTTVDVSSVVLS